MIVRNPGRGRSVEGIWAAVLTAVGDDFSPDASRAVPYYRGLLQRGCQGINVLGTTGEAMSFSAEQRLNYMERLSSSGLPMERMMVGTGAASLGDAIRLTRHAFECNYAAALIMPPFFFREASEDGIVDFFDVLFSRTSPPAKSVLLYNFPKMSGVAFRAALVDRLLGEFPDTIAGMKDSSNDANLQAEVVARHPDFAILPGSERDLPAAKARGATGCISGSVALWPELAHEVFAFAKKEKADELTRKRAALDGLPFIPAVRYLTAALCDDSGWERAMPPQVALTAEQRSLLQGEGR